MSKIKAKSIRRKILYGLIIAVIALIFFLLSSLLVINIHIANHQVLLEKHKTISDLLLQRQKNGIIAPADVSYIDYWMTFKYINLTFKFLDNNYIDWYSPLLIYYKFNHEFLIIKIV